MAARTVWWKDGDDERVTPYKARSRALEIDPECNQAFEVHGKLGDVLVHPGDTIVTLDGGGVRVERP